MGNPGITYTHDYPKNAGTDQHPILDSSSTATYNAAQKTLTLSIKPRSGGSNISQTFDVLGSSSPFLFRGTISSEGDFIGYFTVDTNKNIAGRILRSHSRGRGVGTEDDTGTFTGTHSY